jgi:hypothetical protein
MLPRTAEHHDVRIQLWLEVVQKARRSSASTFASSSTFASTHTTKSDQNPTPHAKSVRTTSFSSEKIMPVQMLSRVEVAHILVFGKTELPHEKQVLWIIRS